MASLHDILSDSTADWTRSGPATEAAVQSLSANCDDELPKEYVCFLRYSNGGEGFRCIEPWYFQLCSSEKVMEDIK